MFEFMLRKIKQYNNEAAVIVGFVSFMGLFISSIMYSSVGLGGVITFLLGLVVVIGLPLFFAGAVRYWGSKNDE